MSQKFGTRRRKSKEETRRVIFQTAYQLLEEKGYDGMTMRDLAAMAGVGLGTIFQHFKDKSSLLVAVFQSEFQPLVNQAFRTIPQSDLKTQLLYLVRIFYTFYAKRPHISRILVKELYIDLNRSERIRNALSQDMAKLEALFKAAQERGEIDSRTVISDAVMLWWAYYLLILLQALQEPDFDLEHQMVLHERLIDQHFLGIGKKVS